MGKYILDTLNSQVSFEVRYMMMTKITGTFNNFNITLDIDNPANMSGAKIYGEAEVSSIDTNVKERDDHLRSEEFFDADKYPKITFESTEVRKAGQTVKVFGDLTMLGHTENIMVILYNKGSERNPWGVDVYGFEGKFELNRNDYGLTWNKPLANGGVLVSNKVTIRAELQFSDADIVVDQQ